MQAVLRSPPLPPPRAQQAAQDESHADSEASRLSEAHMDHI